jgi:hypothetical protein
MIHWTLEEDKILKEVYENSIKEVILSKLPNREWKSIYRRSILLGLSRDREGGWTEAEDNLLEEIYASNTHEFIMSKFLGKTWKAIRWHANMVLRLVRDEDAVQEETKKTNRANRGTDYPTQSASVRARVTETVREKYGVDNVFKSKEIQDKIIKTNIEKFGYKSPMQNPDVFQKAKDTNMARYGVENPLLLVTKEQRYKNKDKAQESSTVKEDIFDKLPYPKHIKLDPDDNSPGAV